jgi:hypothetical protein
MSWGMSEFRSETSYDSHFTTPSRHTGVTFVAASGDDGSGFGPIWPSISKNVLAVGGTTLSLTGSAGTYLSESAWRDSGGGISRFESVPSYQSSVATSGARSAPDVSYNADPNTGFAVYDSVSFQGDSGWEVIGGTSAGTPQWAALIAIADQGRALIGSAALDGATGTLPAIYALAKTSSVYAANFHDIADSQSFFGFNPFGWFGFGGFRRWFFMSGASATTGYDTVTGLGSPRAGNLVAALIKGGASAARATQVARTTTTRMASAARAVTIAGSTLTPALTETFETASVTRVVEDLSPVARPTPAAALTESAALRAAGFSGRLARGSNNIVDGSSIAELKAMPTVIATVGRAVEVVGQKLTSAWRGIDAMRQNWTGAIRQDSVWANVPTPAMKLDLRPESSWRKVAAILAAVATVGAAMRRRSAGRELPGMPRRV